MAAADQASQVPFARQTSRPGGFTQCPCSGARACDHLELPAPLHSCTLMPILTRAHPMQDKEKKELFLLGCARGLLPDVRPRPHCTILVTR
jgi:hypothetical protein